MEKDRLSLLGQLEKSFGLTGKDIRTYSPLALAYIGDGVYELIIRTIVVRRINRPVNELHKSTTAYVNAESQARLIEVLLEGLTEEEQSVYRRGRNAKVSSASRHTSIADYHKSTGFEALIGYLYLTDQMDRALELVKRGLEKL